LCDRRGRCAPVPDWKGFDGGEEAGAAIDGFFDAVRDRSRPVEKEGGQP
jgi:hypothetical protein